MIYAKDVKAAKTIAILIGLFVLCWGPFFAIILCYAYDQSCPVPGSLLNIIKWMEYTSSCLNPIIYSCLNRSYRRAFRKLYKLFRSRQRAESSSSAAGSRSKTEGSFSESIVPTTDSGLDGRRWRSNSIIRDCVRPKESRI